MVRAYPRPDGSDRRRFYRAAVSQLGQRPCAPAAFQRSLPSSGSIPRWKKRCSSSRSTSGSGSRISWKSGRRRLQTKKKCVRRNPSASSRRKQRLPPALLVMEGRQNEKNARFPSGQRPALSRRPLAGRKKITGRTLNALQMRGVKFPDGWNPRKTPEFKQEYQRQLTQFRQQQAAKKSCEKGNAAGGAEAGGIVRGRAGNSFTPIIMYANLKRTDLQIDVRLIPLRFASLCVTDARPRLCAGTQSRGTPFAYPTILVFTASGCDIDPMQSYSSAALGDTRGKRKNLQ